MSTWYHITVYCQSFCSNHRSIFSRESMPPPSDLATHWPISGQSALIPSTSQELFLLAIFWKSLRSESTQPAVKKDPSLVLSYGYSSVEDLHWRYAATFYQLHTRINPVACHTTYLQQWHTFCCYSEHLLPIQEPTYNQRHQKETFLTLIRVYFCYKNKPFVVVFQRSFVICFVLQINL